MLGPSSGPVAAGTGPLGTGPLGTEEGGPHEVGKDKAAVVGILMAEHRRQLKSKKITELLFQFQLLISHK